MIRDNIYQNVEGNQLLNSDNFPFEITNYLYMERNLISQIVNDYDVLIEIGCFDACYLPLAYANGKKYIGIDISDKNIREAKRRADFKYIPSEYYELLELNAEDLTKIGEFSSLFKNERLKKIFIFPFNVVGNIKDINSVILSLKSLSIDFLISSFLTNDYANYWRQKYYESCCTGVSMRPEPNGIRFTSDEGLDSIAYSINWFINTFSSLKQDNNFFQFGNIGISLYIKTS